MAGVLSTASAAGRGRPRKGVAILAVTVASLGVGGLAAAGPGILPRGLDFISGDPAATPAVATENPANPPASDVVPGGSSAAQPATPGEGSATPASPDTPAGAAMAGDPPGTRESGTGGVGNASTAENSDPADDGSGQERCVEGGHGQGVADAAGSPGDSSGPPGQQVSEVARPDCGNTTGTEDATDAGHDNQPDQAATPNPGQPAEPGTNGQSATPNPGQPAEPGNDNVPTDPGASEPPADPVGGPPTDTPGSGADPNRGQPAEPAKPGENGQPATSNLGRPAEPGNDNPTDG